MEKAEKQSNFSNYEIIALAIYLLGGESQTIDAEDIAVKSYELAPERFSWRKYPEYISVESVRKRLYETQKDENKCYFTGSDKKGWLLTLRGVQFAKKILTEKSLIQFSKKTHTLKEKQWLKSEKTRMIASEAFQKIQEQGLESVTQQEAESFFRLDEYVTGDTRERKISRIVNNFSDDEILGEFVTVLSEKVQEVRNGKK